jgi:hypothetical protein
MAMAHFEIKDFFVALSRGHNSLKGCTYFVVSARKPSRLKLAGHDLQAAGEIKHAGL